MNVDLFKKVTLIGCMTPAHHQNGRLTRDGISSVAHVVQNFKARTFGIQPELNQRIFLFVHEPTLQARHTCQEFARLLGISHRTIEGLAVSKSLIGINPASNAHWLGIIARSAAASLDEKTTALVVVGSDEFCRRLPAVLAPDYVDAEMESLRPSYMHLICKDSWGHILITDQAGE